MAALSLLLAGVVPGAPEPGPTRLVVVLSIDQFRGDYIQRFQDLYGPDGFNRLLRDGRYYDNANYLHAITFTGPGHSTILTGTYPNVSGMVGNGFYDQVAGRSFYCVQDEDAHLVRSSGPDANAGSSSPRLLMAGTVGETLERATGGNAHTISISSKDRAAILMGGRHPDACVWWDTQNAEFVTSTYYGQALPAWAKAVNDRHPAEAFFHKSWEPSAKPAEYEKRCTIDDFPGESAQAYTKRTFPHVLGDRSQAPDHGFYDQLMTSPFQNAILVDTALEAVRAEKLGADDVPDLLTLSFSSNDYVGHAYGPDSWEVMDCAIRTDGEVARLLKGLDEAVGAGKYTLFVTADHGVCPLPEAMEQIGVPAGRIAEAGIAFKLEATLADYFGKPASGQRYIRSFSEPWLVLNKGAIPAGPRKDKTIEEVAAEFFAAQPGIARAYTRRDLLGQGDPTDPLRRALQFSYYPGRSGDVGVVLAPHFFMAGGAAGTTHGSPYSYDTYVPVLAFGAGIRPGRSGAAVSPPQIAPTIAELLHVLAPTTCEVPPLPRALAGYDD